MSHVQLMKACEAMRRPEVTQEKLFSIRRKADLVPTAHPLVAPHVARNVKEFTTKTGKRVRHEGAIDERTTRRPGYRVSQIVRRVIETLFEDAKQHDTTIRQVKLRGRDSVSDVFTIAMLAVNLRRLPKLFAAHAVMAGTG